MALGDAAVCNSEYVGAVFAVFIAVFSCWDCDLLELFFTVLGVAVFCCYFSWNYLWIFYSVFFVFIADALSDSAGVFTVFIAVFCYSEWLWYILLFLLFKLLLFLLLLKLKLFLNLYFFHCFYCRMLMSCLTVQVFLLFLLQMSCLTVQAFV